MNYQILIEGQTIPIPEEIGGDDEMVRKTLAPFYPDAANAMITRVEKDGITTVNVVKRAGTKGNYQQALETLEDCQGGENPAIALYRQIQLNVWEELGPEELLALDGQIEQALVEGEQQAKAVEHAQKRLAETRPVAAQAIVVGF